MTVDDGEARLLCSFDGPNHKFPFLDVPKNFFPCLSPGVRGALALRVFVGVYKESLAIPGSD